MIPFPFWSTLVTDVLGMWPPLFHTTPMGTNRGSSYRRFNIIMHSKNSMVTSSYSYYKCILPFYSMVLCCRRYSINVYFWLWIGWWHTPVPDIFSWVISCSEVLGLLFTGYSNSLVKSVGVWVWTCASSTPWTLRHCCQGQHMVTNPLLQARMLLDSPDTTGRVLTKFPNHLAHTYWERV